MEIWILVGILLVLAIVFFVMSIYAKDDSIQAHLDEFSIQQAHEIAALKARIVELETVHLDAQSLTKDTVSTTRYSTDEYVEDSSISVEEISDMTREEVIRLYSQGYTMSEIAHHVALRPETIQVIVDDYIENR